MDADGIIIAGHTRYKAAQALGMNEVPVVVASDLTPEQCAAYRLADNRVGELATWDSELLAQELDGLADLDMSAFGFIGDADIDALFTDDIPDRDASGQDEQEPEHETVTCPHCGETFEL